MVRQTARGQGCCAGGCCCPSSVKRGRVASTVSPGAQQQREPSIIQMVGGEANSVKLNSTPPSVEDVSEDEQDQSLRANRFRIKVSSVSKGKDLLLFRPGDSNR